MSTIRLEPARVGTLTAREGEGRWYGFDLQLAIFALSLTVVGLLLLIGSEALAGLALWANDGEQAGLIGALLAAGGRLGDLAPGSVCLCLIDSDSEFAVSEVDIPPAEAQRLVNP